MSNYFNAEDMAIESQTTETLVKNLEDYLSNEALDYGDKNKKVTYGESVIISICEELRTREGDFEELIDAAMLEAVDLSEDDFFDDDVTNL